jgi:uncharacterized protein (DUF488 family)
VYRIGHSDRPIGSFLTLLRARGVGLLADVRRFPGSQSRPQYGRDALAASPADAGIGYVFLGDALRARDIKRDPADTLTAAIR